jgi:uncharacterized protein
MKIDVRTCLELKGKPLSLEHTYELPQLPERNKQLLHIKPVHFVGKGEMQSGVFIVQGELSGTYILACSRCLTDLEVKFTHDFEEHFNIKAKLSDPDEDEEEEKDIHEVIGQEIDLLPHIEEEILMSIPFVPLCESEEKCVGNLPQEGKDWNVLTEQNKNERIDPRLADLAKFFDQDKND